MVAGTSEPTPLLYAPEEPQQCRHGPGLTSVIVIGMQLPHACGKLVEYAEKAVLSASMPSSTCRGRTGQHARCAQGRGARQRRDQKVLFV